MNNPISIEYLPGPFVVTDLFRGECNTIQGNAKSDHWDQDTYGDLSFTVDLNDLKTEEICNIADQIYDAKN